MNSTTSSTLSGSICNSTWDSVSPQVVTRIENLYQHRDYLAAERDSIAKKKEEVLFKQRQQLLGVADGLAKRVEERLENEKEMLFEHFDKMVLQESRRNIVCSFQRTPNDSAYCKNRMHSKKISVLPKSRSVSFDLTTLQKHALATQTPDSELLNTTQKLDCANAFQVSHFSSTLQNSKLGGILKKTSAQLLQSASSSLSASPAAQQYSTIAHQQDCLCADAREIGKCCASQIVQTTQGTYYSQEQNNSSGLFSCKHSLSLNSASQNHFIPTTKAKNKVTGSAGALLHEDDSAASDLTMSGGVAAKTQLFASTEYLMQRLRLLESEVERLQAESLAKTRRIAHLERSEYQMKTMALKTNRWKRAAKRRQNERKIRISCNNSVFVALRQKLCNKEKQIERFEKMLDSLFEASLKNESELKALQKQNDTLMQTYENFSAEKIRAFEALEIFKLNLEHLLEGYSQKLHKFNENEAHYERLTQENTVLRQERDELLALMKRLQNEIRRPGAR